MLFMIQLFCGILLMFSVKVLLFNQSADLIKLCFLCRSCTTLKKRECICTLNAVLDLGQAGGVQAQGSQYWRKAH